MAACATCKSTILFGGVRDGQRRYCNQTCYGKDEFVRFARTIPGERVHETAAQLHRGRCPRCQGSGPVEYHVSYRIWSAVAFTQWSQRPAVSCLRCANRRKLADLLFCAALGWWGFPWGLVMTPVQILKNLAGLRFSAPRVAQPSAELLHFVRQQLAAQALAEHPPLRAAR